MNDDELKQGLQNHSYTAFPDDPKSRWWIIRRQTEPEINQFVLVVAALPERGDLGPRHVRLLRAQAIEFLTQLDTAGKGKKIIL